ncbi:hypothetical protein [Amycolatopsis sp. lyj-23]|uniref:hypothetical protein n=1 Tax=Amycolatopsis sp. lyj-23 TaxID=2789283 RepID=UPI00397AC016
MATVTVHTTPHEDDESAYARACRLIGTELGGQRLTTDPPQWLDDLVRARRYKAALIAAICRICLVSGPVEACRVAEAIYPYLNPDGFRTEAALAAAWRIIAPDAGTWSEQQQDERRDFTDDCLTRAITEANTAVA